MRIVQVCVVLVLLAGFAFSPRVASAQAGGPSDILSEGILDLGTGGPVPVTAPPPVSFVFPEAAEPFDTVLTLPGREIDFLEPPVLGGHLSDRLSIFSYPVRVASDGNPLGLPPRAANATRIPASALESFQPIRIEAKSDGDVQNPTQTASDTLTITVGYFGPGTGTVVFSGVIPEPLPEGVTEPVLGFFIPPTFFDLEEPLAETGGVPGIISDYVDLLNGVEVRFISSDDPAVYANLPPANGFIVENFETGGGVRYSLNFVSDAVPEPASLTLLGMGLLSLGLIGRRR